MPISAIHKWGKALLRPPYRWFKTTQLYWDFTDWHCATFGLKTQSTEHYLETVRNGIENGSFASFKLGISPMFTMYYEIARETMPKVLFKAFQDELRWHMVYQHGLFPGTETFMERWNSYYAEHVKTIDFIGIDRGVYFDRKYPKIQKKYNLSAKFVLYYNMEPDYSIPYDPEQCYLPSLQGKKLLIICPFAPFLAERANKETYEKVWQTSQRPWFNPASVDALAIPYGFAKETQEKYADSIEFLENCIFPGIDAKDFNVALIAAGGYAGPIASYIKSKGKTALDMGSSTQLLFGVGGARWKQQRSRLDYHFNEFWTSVPEQYVPEDKHLYCDQGAYW